MKCGFVTFLLSFQIQLVESLLRRYNSFGLCTGIYCVILSILVCIIITAQPLVCVTVLPISTAVTCNVTKLGTTSATFTGFDGFPLWLPTFSIACTTSSPSVTLPKTTCFPSNHDVSAVQRKN